MNVFSWNYCSKGKHGHIPYRDSKLTRILQNSLGGNARTAIICTMSPARSHLEQSKNTLLFATCAKEVTTNAQVNMVVSEKALVKQLQRELMRMENELKNLGLGGSSSSTSDEFHSLLKQKEEVIEKVSLFLNASFVCFVKETSLNITCATIYRWRSRSRSLSGKEM